MQIEQSYLTQTPIFKNQERLVPKGIILYTIGCPQPSAKVLIHNWNRETFEGSCPHALVDARNGKCFTLLPWEVKGSHAKSEIDNDYIGIVMCEPSIIKYIKKDKFRVFNRDVASNSMQKTIASATDLCASLCIAYDLSPETSVLSSKECKKIGSQSRFKTPEHFWNGLGSAFTMTDFRTSIAKKMEELCNKVVTAGMSETSESEEVKPIADNSPNPIKTIRIIVPNLRIRTGPGRENATIGEFTGVGDFEISDCQNGSGSTRGWAKLADGRGWVSLDYATIL